MPNLRGFRYLDDYEAALKTRADTEEGQSVLEGALGDFELVANPFKTHILELPLSPFPPRGRTCDLNVFRAIRRVAPSAACADRGIGYYPAWATRFAGH
jgi:hypothetical protein